MKSLALALALGITFAAGAALAEPPARKPIVADTERTTVIELDHYGRTTVIERARTRSKRAAVFTAAAQPIDPGAMLVFTARSISPAGNVERWRCVATRNVSECFARPLSLSYLPGDTSIVLVVEVVPVGAIEVPAAS